MDTRALDTRPVSRFEDDDVGYPVPMCVGSAQCAGHTGGVCDQDGLPSDTPCDVMDRTGEKTVVQRILQVDEETCQQGPVAECPEPEREWYERDVGSEKSRNKDDRLAVAKARRTPGHHPLPAERQRLQTCLGQRKGQCREPPDREWLRTRYRRLILPRCTCMR